MTLAGEEDIASHALKVDMSNFEIESKVTRSCRSLISVAFHMSRSWWAWAMKRSKLLLGMFPSFPSCFLLPRRRQIAVVID